ncbi:hypothetical protein HBI25_095660 [Parastagonospora nodorum]|nr:hypothetical protein HBH49_146410 [Parastagonospora nodorum]KAH4122583.1 hypothetical protein HBH47_084120 [Parastagonospora nodorum]KAH4170751.1 hypothetical protein HBH43_102700 [Parastagonospora nodorum]KAH4300135.1 hypothetical protein HBI01_113530 [Parastagonospora nodorum]KAH4318615.1 hypothetical protein HBI02_003750 [Parastagonospora nodorum]
MALTAVGTREAQDDLVKSFVESLVSTRALAEERIAEFKRLNTDPDIAAVWLANKLKRTIGEYPRIYDQMVALAHAEVLISEEMQASSWKSANRQGTRAWTGVRRLSTQL